jgi:hypothetical protein
MKEDIEILKLQNELRTQKTIKEFYHDKAMHIIDYQVHDAFFVGRVLIDALVDEAYSYKDKYDKAEQEIAIIEKELLIRKEKE